MLDTREFVVSPSEKGKRLDLFLCIKNNDLSRSFIKSLIIKGNIYVNSSHGASSAYKVKAGDQIKLIVDQVQQTSVKAENIPLDIIFEDKDYLVVNKPYDMVVHPASGNWQGTLVNAVMNHLSDISNVGDKARPGIVHRLDKETSGVIIIAKNNETLWWLTRQFAERKVQKTYLCLGSGNMDINNILSYKLKGIHCSIDKDFLIVESGLDRSKTNRKVVSIDEEGKNAITYIKVLKKKIFESNSKNFTYSLCEVMPKTGRTHQIRVHMKALGFPLWGDKIYLGEKQYRLNEEIARENNLDNRLFLHAKKISFTDKDGKQREFEAQLPKELQKIIK